MLQTQIENESTTTHCLEGGRGETFQVILIVFQAVSFRINYYLYPSASANDRQVRIMMKLGNKSSRKPTEKPLSSSELITEAVLKYALEGVLVINPGGHANLHQQESL